MKRTLALLKADWRSISRDLLLVITVIVPLFVAVFIRVAVPIASDLLAIHAGFDLSTHCVFIAGVAILMTPMMVGAMAGLQILEDRDERILSYISVTPLTREGYLTWKLFTPVLIGGILTPISLLIMNIIPLRLGIVIPVTFLAAMAAPVYAMMLPAFAANKVEGLAVAKASGILMWAPFAGYLLPPAWSILAGTLPPYWPPMALVAGYKGDKLWGYIIAGTAVNLIWLMIIKNRFRKRTES